MKKWLVYVLGIITGILLTFALAFWYKNSEKTGLEMFDEPGEYMEYSRLEIFQVLSSGGALARSGVWDVVFVIPDGKQQFYDNQEIALKGKQRAQRVGTYRYTAENGLEKTVPAVIITDVVESFESDRANYTNVNSRKLMFDKPGACVSRKDFQVQEVLESGDAIALEIKETYYDLVITSDLEVLILAQEGKNFYDKQIVKTPKGKCARHVGNYKYYGGTIPIIAFK